MDPDYEEQRTPQSLADMLGLRDRGVEIGSWTNGVGSITISAPRLGCGVTTRSVVTAGRCGRWGMQRGRYRGGMLYEDADLHEPGSGNTLSPSCSAGAGYSSCSARTGGSSSCRRRPPAPQQQLRYTSLLDTPPSHSQPRGADSYGNESVESDQVLERWLQQPLVPTGQVPVEEEDVLPTYEEAIAQPANTRISVPLIAEAERQVPALITHHNHNYQHQPRVPPSNSTRNNNYHPPKNPITPALDHTCPSSSFSSRFTRLLRRRHSLDYVRPPPPQEGIPLELLTDKFGNRRRDILWRERGGGEVAWLGNVENSRGSGGSGLPPRVLTRRGVRWEFD